MNPRTSTPPFSFGFNLLLYPHKVYGYYLIVFIYHKNGNALYNEQESDVQDHLCIRWYC